jgi:hypothetical protein
VRMARRGECDDEGEDDDDVIYIVQSEQEVAVPASTSPPMRGTAARPSSRSRLKRSPPIEASQSSI